MELFLDNKELTLSSNPGSLEGVIQEVMNNYLNDGRIVWSVKLNGGNYNENMPNDAKNIRFDTIRTLEIGTKNKKEIVLDFLKNSGELIEILSQSAVKISGLFRVAEQQKANSHYIIFLESYQQLYQMIQESINLLLPNFQEVFLEGGSITAKIDALEKLLNQMISSQEKEEWMMLADLLDYEFVPLLNEWKRVLPILEKML